MHPTSTQVRARVDTRPVRRFSPTALRTLRDRARLSQSELAVAIGRSRESIGLYERDLAQPPIDVADRIAAALGVDLAALLTEIPPAPCNLCLSFTMAERTELGTCHADARCPMAGGEGV